MAPKRYEILDALRGVAALAVVFFHFSQVKLSPALVPNGYLAVDFFFVLSGFVVAHAYENALKTRISWWAFMVRRVIRLYPMAILGAMMGLAVLLMKWHSFPGKVDPLSRILLSGLFNGLMLPTFFGGEASHHEIFPGNGPLWTLFFELLVNALWAWFGVRMKTLQLFLVSFLSAMSLAYLAIHFHTVNMGFDIATFLGGMARVCFGFTLGVVIFRLHDGLPFLKVAAAPFILATAIIFIFVIPFPPRAAVFYELISIFIFLPAIVVIGAAQATAGQLGKILGDLSYPVYVLHFPILLIGSGLHQTVLSRVNLFLLDSALFLIILVFSGLITKIYDHPTRTILSRSILSNS